MHVLVTDGDSRAALAVTRSLGRKGHKIMIAGPSSGNLAASSCYCHKFIPTSDPLGEGGKFLIEIETIAVENNLDVIIPVTEQSIYLLNQIREKLPANICLACAPAERMEAVSNKYELFKIAASLGVPIPETLFIDGYEDFLEKEAGIGSFPVVVKPAFSKVMDGDQILSTKVMYAGDRSELKQLYRTEKSLRYPSLIQEMIVGEGTGLFSLFDKNRHLVLFAHRRVLEKPPTGGVSVYSQSVPLDPEMIQAAETLLAAVGWEGVAMVEFKRDIRDGRAKLMEINGRFWGSLQLAVSSGVDFPVLFLDYLHQRKPTTLRADYHVGQKMKWVLGLLDHLFIRIKFAVKKKQLPDLPLSIGQVIAQLFNGADGQTTFDVFDRNDLKPFLTEIKSYLKKSCL